MFELPSVPTIITPVNPCTRKRRPLMSLPSSAGMATFEVANAANDFTEPSNVTP